MPSDVEAIAAMYVVDDENAQSIFERSHWRREIGDGDANRRREAAQSSAAFFSE